MKLSRKTILKTVQFFFVATGSTLVSLSVFLYFSSDIIVLGSVKASHIGEPEDRIDAYVSDGHRDQYYFTSFANLHLLRGDYPNDSLGIRLHSPAMTFGILKDPEKNRYLLFLKSVVTQTGKKVLVLDHSFKIP